MIWATDVTRKEFLDLLQGRLSDAQIRPINETDPNVLSVSEIGVFWRRNPKENFEFPTLVVLSNDKHRDFFAWTATYISTIKPFSAFCRVVDSRTAGDLWKKPSSATRFSVELATSCLGLIFAEAALYSEGRSLKRQTSFRTAWSTCSFAMARGMYVGIAPWLMDSVQNSWVRARQAVSLDRLFTPFEELQRPWWVCLSLWDYSSILMPRDVIGLEKIAEACRDLKKTGQIRDSIWSALTVGSPGLSQIQDEMRGTREYRVELLERALKDLTKMHPSKSEVVAFVIGYLTSLIAPGSFDHLSLLAPIADSLPSALLWYGLCAGLSPDNRLLDSFDGLGRRVMREVQREPDLLRSPSCDIALAELEILGGSASNLQMLSSGKPYVEVEIFPCISLPCRVVANGAKLTEAETREVEQQALFDDRDKADIRRFKERLDDAVWMIDELSREFSRVFKADSPQTKQNKVRKKT